MKAFVFDPIWSQLITPKLLNKIEKAGIELHLTEEVRPITDCAALYQGDEPRILAVNPDYVGWKLPAKVYQEIPNLKGIFGAATSYSWIERSYADANHIPICNIRNFSTEAVAEWAITMMWNLARQVPRLIKNQFPLDFNQDFMRYRGVELHGKTAGIIGLGNIGAAIAKRCAGLGMQVCYWSKSPKEVPYTRSDLKQLFAESDVIFPTLVDNTDTRSIISPALINSMKSSAMLVSVVHGLFDEELVLEKVKNHSLFGYAFEAQPASFGNFQGNVWAAPAYAWVTDGSMHNSMVKWIDNMICASQGQFPMRVNN